MSQLEEKLTIIKQFATENCLFYSIFRAEHKINDLIRKECNDYINIINGIPYFESPYKYVINKKCLSDIKNICKVKNQSKYCGWPSDEWGDKIESTTQEYYSSNDENDDENYDEYSDELVFYFQTFIQKEFSSSSCNYSHYIHNAVYGPSIKMIYRLEQYLSNKHEKKVDNKGMIYEWSSYEKRFKPINKYCTNTKIDELVGLEKHFFDIKKDVETIISKSELLERLGATSGFNYLLYGPPGTGKSSSIKAIAHDLNLPIFMLKMCNICPEDYSKALCPDKGGKIKIVLIEDFDRYLQKQNGEENVSELLNALDGIYPAPGVIRFFSANFPENVESIGAINSRMRRKLYFPTPSVENIEKHLLSIFPEDDQSIKYFAQKIKGKNLSMRTINHYISRFLIDENPIKMALDNLDDWLLEMNRVNIEESNIDKDEKIIDSPLKV